VKHVAAVLIFLGVFFAVGIAMHSALYGQPGIFVWSLVDDPASGNPTLVRTTLAAPGPEVTVSATPEDGAEKEENGNEAAAVEPAGEKVAEPAEASNDGGKPPGDTGEIVLFDGKDLGKWKKTSFGGEGDVFVNESGHLEFGFGAVITGVNWGEEAPLKTNYEISLEAMKLDGNDFFIALTFPVKESHATFVVGGWGGGVVGISCVDDLNASENETMSIEGFENDVWYKIRVQVTDDQLQAWIDDDQKVALDLEGRKISLLPGDIELSVPIGIAAYQTRAQYRNIVLRKLPATP